MKGLCHGNDMPNKATYVEAGEKRGLFPEAGYERAHWHGSFSWKIDYGWQVSQFLLRDGSCVLSLNLDLHKTLIR